MRQQRLVREQVALRVLHADRCVNPPAEPEVGHVADDQVAAVTLRREPLAEELDVLRREVETAHPIAAVGEPDQVRSRAAGDVEHAADGAALRELPEAVDEEVDLALAVHVERDLVEPRCRVLPIALHRMCPHQLSNASRITQEAAMPVRPVGSQAWVTSTRSPPITWQSPSSRTTSISSGTRSPPGSGEPVPGASAGSSTSTSIVT